MKAYYKLFLIYMGIVLFVFSGVYSVFSTDLFFDAQIQSKFLISKNIFLDSEELRSNIVFYESKNDLSKYFLKSFCNNKSKFLGKKDNLYIYKIEILDTNCKMNSIYLTYKDKLIKKSFLKLNLFSKSKLFDFYSDRSNSELLKILKQFNALRKQKEELLSKNNKIIQKLKLIRNLKELNYQKEFLQKNLKERKEKYLIPVKGYEINKKTNKIPNAGRPYRASYTDGIHHGWDVMAPLNTSVRALSYGKIIRIVKDFKFSDLKKIKKQNPNYEQKLENLDILRGNQVWLKTALGDVVFYSHLRDIPDSLEVGDIVEAGTILGKVGISGVPDKNYDDYHLHFAIMKNPYIKSKAGKYTFLDYMKWDWYFRKKSVKYILENENKIFKHE